MSSRYVDSKYASQTYRPKDGLMSPGLLRARRPYRVKNAITGIVLGIFGVAVWAHSINAVKQDVFDDVDEEARRLASKDGTVATTQAADASALTAGAVGLGEVAMVSPPPLQTQKTRGILAQIADRSFPGLLDADRKTFIWGAPPVDNIGKMQQRRT